MKQQRNAPTSVGCSEGSSKRKVYSNPGLFKEGRTIPNEESKVRIIETGKRRPNEAKSQQKKGHNKDQSRNKIQNKTVERINETRAGSLRK